jgi:hypothetical protein
LLVTLLLVTALVAVAAVVEALADRAESNKSRK